MQHRTVPAAAIGLPEVNISTVEDQINTVLHATNLVHDFIELALERNRRPSGYSAADADFDTISHAIGYLRETVREAHETFMSYETQVFAARRAARGSTTAATFQSAAA